MYGHDAVQPKWDAKKMRMRKFLCRTEKSSSGLGDVAEGKTILSCNSYWPGRGRGEGRESRDRDRDRRCNYVAIKAYLENGLHGRQLQLGACACKGSAVIMNQITVPRGALISKEFILRSIGQYVEDVKPLVLRTGECDLTFFIESDETAEAIRAISRRVRDPRTNTPISFLLSRVPAGFAAVSPDEMNAIEVCKNKNISITKLSELEKLKRWPVETLFLDQNPLCASYCSADVYLRAIHAVFPKVSMLDGISVHPYSSVILTDFTDDYKEIPTLKPSFYGGEESRSLTETFIMEYLAVYDDPDAGNRRKLLNAYDEKATFTLCAENLPDVNKKKPYADSPENTIYRRISHNINFIDRWERHRDQIVYKGVLDIIVQLRKLPATKHLMDTFVVDASMITEKHMCIAIQGFFRDGVVKVDDSGAAKYFCRNFIIVNKGGGKMVIVNDMLFISNVFSERIQRYKSLTVNLSKISKSTFSDTGITNGLSTMRDSSVMAHNSLLSKQNLMPVQLAAAAETEMQQQMIESFSRESSMKPEWSMKCLADQNWDYEAAKQAFLALRDKIPPEAFK